MAKKKSNIKNEPKKDIPSVLNRMIGVPMIAARSLKFSADETKQLKSAIDSKNRERVLNVYNAAKDRMQSEQKARVADDQGGSDD